MKRITWKIEGQFMADAEKVYNELQEIGDTYTPDDVLERAKDESSELHKCFDWDDTVAAYKWRKQTARMVCNSLVLTVIESEKEPPKQFRMIQHTGDSREGYQSAVKLYQNPKRYNALLERMKVDATRFIDRYESLPEAAEVIVAMRKVI